MKYRYKIVDFDNLSPINKEGSRGWKLIGFIWNNDRISKRGKAIMEKTYEKHVPKS
jgi:hypothetical protein